jgi:hypothetical protein
MSHCTGDGGCLRGAQLRPDARCAFGCRAVRCATCPATGPAWAIALGRGRCPRCARGKRARAGNATRPRRAAKRLARKCAECGRPLVPIGRARANGKAHEDWGARRLHKKCWLELQ